MPDIKEPGIISPASPTTPSLLPSPFPELHKAASICSKFRAQLKIKLQQICLEEELLRPAVPGAITALSCRGRGESWQQQENRTQHHSAPQWPQLSGRESSRREREGEIKKTRDGWMDRRERHSACRCGERKQALNLETETETPGPTHAHTQTLTQTPPIMQDRR